MNDAADSTIETITTTLDRVDSALRRLRDGSYRRCEVCGEVISSEVLADEPLRSTCSSHQID